MQNEYNLKVGDVSENGQIQIVDEDRLCYKVKSISKGASGIRTISKDVFIEFCDYYKNHPDSNANEARQELSGKTEIDKFEYGYASTLWWMAKMALNKNRVSYTKDNYNILPLQQIYYGAPGTGKSYAIDQIISPNNSIRITFHPDSDYSTFVGCYKPCKRSAKSSISNVSLEKLIAMANEITSRPNGDKVNLIIDFVTQYAERLCEVVDENDHIISLNNLLNKVLGFSNETYLAKVIFKTLEERKDKAEITYDFVPQAFTTAYVNAWKNLAKPYYLVIEEINRGNCAQIFGDMFQLLDRDSQTGFSCYKISPDKDLQTFLRRAFADVNISDNEIKQGIKMQLPCNLNILATMNTSDQSLFPIDSAFKRRWDWKYIPIKYDAMDWKFESGENLYSWGEFLRVINPQIYDITASPDKQMGYFFVKVCSKTGIISEDMFLNKVLFYLWTDVFKDYDVSSEVFYYQKENRSFRFTDFFEDSDALECFIANLGLNPVDQNPQNAAEENNEGGRKKYKTLKVTFNDGTHIQENTIVDTYLNTLQTIGIEKAAEVANSISTYRRRGYAIITKEPVQELIDNGYTYTTIGDYSVLKGIKNVTMSGMLRQISDKLNLGLRVSLE